MFGSRFYNSLGVGHLVSEEEFNSVFEQLKTIGSSTRFELNQSVELKKKIRICGA